LQFIKGDIQSMDLLSFVLLTEQIDTVMHFAAQVRKRCSSSSSTAVAQVTPWQKPSHSSSADVQMAFNLPLLQLVRAIRQCGYAAAAG
jgi:hypothetical protein